MFDAPVSAPPRSTTWPDRDARFYADGMDRSDLGAAAALHAALGPPETLLDIGAGGGHPALGWVGPDTPWLALEPSRYLRARLGRLARRSHPGLRPIEAGWQDVPRLGLPRCDVALAANIGATLDAPAALLRIMRGAARRVAWIVPAQHGPRRYCLSGAVPPALHGEDMQPAHVMVLAQVDPPDGLDFFPWRFVAHFASLDAAEAHCAAQFGLHRARRAALRAHLHATAVPLPDGGVALSAEKRSALMIWEG